MKLRESVALVTGANRGLGKAFVHSLPDAGATRIYAADARAQLQAGAVEIPGDPASQQLKHLSAGVYLRSPQLG